jgi:hypothetical protein
MTYYTLIALDDSIHDENENQTPTWVIEFGSKDREEVQEEKLYLSLSDKCEWYSKLKIIKTKTDRQSEIHKAVKKLNEALDEGDDAQEASLADKDLVDEDF